MTKHTVIPGVRRYDDPAGGWGALKATAKAVRAQMDFAEASKLLLRTNKPDGFDCPGCAWPDKEHTSTFEFCENGAKAVTWEATKKRAGPDFFAAHTVTELLTESDFELEDHGRLTHPMRYDRATDTRDYNARIRKPGGFRLPLPSAERVWITPSGKAEFLPYRGPAAPPLADSPGALTLTTLRSHDQYNTTIYGLDDRYRGVFGRRDVLFMNAGDIAARGLAAGQEVEVVSLADPEVERAMRLTLVPYDIPQGSVGAYYPEANRLIPLSHQDKKSGTPAYKSVPVRVAAGAGAALHA